MRIKLNEDQVLLRDMVRRFADEVVRPRAKEIDESGVFPRQFFDQAAELGLAGVCVAEEYGIPALTFAEAITDSFVSAYDDPDTTTTVNEPIVGGNGRLAEDAIPFELQSFNYAGVHDPGDNPDFDGLDWITWYVSIDYEAGVPIIVGLTVDMWAP